MLYPIRLIALACLGLGVWTTPVSAQIVLQDPLQNPVQNLDGVEADSEEAAAAPAASGPNDALILEQQRIADQFKHLEEVMLRMAEVSATSDPRRAALLRQAVAQSKQRLIGIQFETLVGLLSKDQLSRAVENQKTVKEDLRTLLELLLSEDRGRRLESEKARLREYLKRLEGLLKQQKSLQGRTAGGAELKPLAEPQAELGRQAGGLAEEIKNNEESGTGGDQEPSEKPPTESKSAKESEEHPAPGETKRQAHDDAPRPGSASPAPESAEKGEPAEDNGKAPEGDRPQGSEPAPEGGSSPPEGQAPDQEPSSSSKAKEGHPARQGLEAARAHMREAQERLEQAQREGAVQKQEEAIRELEQAKAKLEEILRQLREEEIGRVLALLETRFRKMLKMQREVYDGTVQLGKVPSAEHNHSHDIEAGRLSSKESEIALEADKALNLMREDGTAVAFPEATEQMREDMQQVVQRLAQSKVDRMTQAIEEDILAALEEMLAALEKAQKDLESKKQEVQPAQGELQDPPLVDMLSELKMIRALQMRVNSRTQRYSELIQGEQAIDAELLDALRRLAERQKRIYRVTHDLERGRNQ